MNYYSTFIQIADDSPTQVGIVPVTKEGKSKAIHAIQYELISEAPYQYTQDDINFMVYAIRNGTDVKSAEERDSFLQKSRPCLRSSALGKKYGWGFHFDGQGKITIYSRESEPYANFLVNQPIELKLIKALRNKRNS